MNPQPKPSTLPDDCLMPLPGGTYADGRAVHAVPSSRAPPSSRQPAGSRALAAWPLELEVEPWRP